MFEMIAEALHFVVDTLYMRLFELVLSHWENVAGTFNHGQLTIFEQYLMPEVDIWLDDAQAAWPYADADEYVESLFGAYDYDVTERAFSDSIQMPVGDMWDIIIRAQEIDELANMFEAMSFL